MLPEPDPNATSASSNVATAADLVAPLVGALAPNLGVRVELWDGSVVGDPEGPAVHLRSVNALRRLLWAPGELGLGRAYVAGDIDVAGDIFEAVEALRPAGSQLRIGPRQLAAVVGTARRTHVLGRPLSPPPEEARPRGKRHSVARDASVVSHHYDVGNDFYALVLGPAMTYSARGTPPRRRGGRRRSGRDPAPGLPRHGW